MTLHSYEVKDPGRLVRECADRVPFAEDTAYLVLVHRANTIQQIVRIQALDLPALLDDDEQISDRLRDAVAALHVPDTEKHEHVIVTILVRPGRCVFGPNEKVWAMGWRYANHFARAFSGDLVVVTEHGWADLMSAEAGHEPAMMTT